MANPSYLLPPAIWRVMGKRQPREEARETHAPRRDQPILRQEDNENSVIGLESYAAHPAAASLPVVLIQPRGVGRALLLPVLRVRGRGRQAKPERRSCPRCALHPHVTAMLRDNCLTNVETEPQTA